MPLQGVQLSTTGAAYTPPAPVADPTVSFVSPAAISVGQRRFDWFGPDGSYVDLSANSAVSGASTLAGYLGTGAAPREAVVQRTPVGGIPRWSSVPPRPVTWPVFLAGPNPPAFLAAWRGMVRSFTATRPPAGVPVAGKLRVTQSDGTFRELAMVYDDGLDPDRARGYGVTCLTAVIAGTAYDPWWYGPDTVGLIFGATTARSYLAPYETLTPTNTLGVQTVTVAGDVDASPVWSVTGPATSVRVQRGSGQQWYYPAALLATDTLVVDTAAGTVTKNGTSVIGTLDWSVSTPFTLPPGARTITLTIAGSTAASQVAMSYRPRYETA